MELVDAGGRLDAIAYETELVEGAIALAEVWRELAGEEAGKKAAEAVVGRSLVCLSGLTWPTAWRASGRAAVASEAVVGRSLVCLSGLTSEPTTR